MAQLFSSFYGNFSYWFSDTILDNNGVTVSDINAGITKLIPGLIDELNNTKNEHTRFIVPDCQVAMPDVAAKTFYNNEDLWWYICLANLINDPFKEYTNNLLYYAFNGSLLTNHDANKTLTNNDKNSKIGTIVELN